MKQTFGILLLALSLFGTTQAHADAYIGPMVGYGLESGNGSTTSSGGLALGGTAGIQLVPNLGVAVTYLHNSEKFDGFDENVSMYLAELNFFSVLFLPSGVHVGQVHTDIGGATSNDLGFGVHTGFAINLVANVTIGISGYWTYVTTTDDKHSVIDIVAPIIFHL
jgi:hypothetical protein